MKRIAYILLAALVVGAAVVYAAQDTTLTERELRNPKTLEPWLEANASDAETRLAAIEAGTSTSLSNATESITVSNVTMSAGAALTLVANTLTTNDKIDGEEIEDDTLDNDSIDWSDMTDLTTDGAVSWGNVAEGELTDSSVVSADIKDGEVATNDLSAAVQDRIIYLTVTGADSAANGTGTITIQAKDAGGNDLDEVVMLRTWIGTANDYGEDALTDYSVSTGVEVDENTANADYTAVSDTNGVVALAVDYAGGGAGSVYAWASIQGRVFASGEVALTAPED